MANVNEVSKWIELFGAKVTNNREYLNKLDTAIGDGDHGSNLTRGAEAVKDKTANTDYDNLSDLFKDVGMTLVSKVGGASGPLYGTAFIEMAKKAKETEDIGDILSAGLEGIQKRGKTETGEKTMVDEWVPVIDSIRSDSFSQKVINESLEGTKSMKATKGRASYLGERSIGHIDPGAQSSAYFFEALLEVGVLDD